MSRKAKRQLAQVILENMSSTPIDEMEWRSCVKRVAVIDACNLLHTCAGLALNSDAGIEHNNRVPDAIGLLLATQKLVAANFEVRIVIPASYMCKAKVDNFFILEQMEQLRLLTIVPYWNHDDVRILKMAAAIGGFVVSNDKYYDHVINGRLDKDVLSVIRSRTLTYTFERLNDGAARSLCRTGLIHELSDGLRTSDSYDFISDRRNAAQSTGVCFRFTGNQYAIMYAVDGESSYKAAILERSLFTLERAEECARCLKLMFEYIQQHFCAMLGVSQPKLPYFHPKFDELPLRFVDFKALYRRYLNSESVWQRIQSKISCVEPLS